MRARLYEMMARFHDPYGDSPEKYGVGSERRSLLRRALSAARTESIEQSKWPQINADERG